jgi:hypothetical protein
MSSDDKSDEQWISVYDRFPSGQWADSVPDISEQVLICTEGGVGAAAYDRAKSVWFSGGLTKECGRVEFQPYNHISWWRPMPKPIDLERLPYPWMTLEENAKKAKSARSHVATPMKTVPQVPSSSASTGGKVEQPSTAAAPSRDPGVTDTATISSSPAALSSIAPLAPHHSDAEVRRMFRAWADETASHPTCWEDCYIAGYRQANKVEFAASATLTSESAFKERLRRVCEAHQGKRRRAQAVGLRGERSSLP